LQLVAAGAIVAAAIVTLRLREAPVAHEVRERLLMFTPTRSEEAHV